MRNHEKRLLPLKTTYPVKEACQRLDLSYLHAVMQEQDNEQTLRRLLTILRANQMTTIQDMLEANWHELNKLRQLGATSRQLLATLLERVVHSPELLLDETAAEREQKLHSIKERLREMGLVR